MCLNSKFSRPLRKHWQVITHNNKFRTTSSQSHSWLYRSQSVAPSIFRWIFDYCQGKRKLINIWHYFFSLFFFFVCVLLVRIKFSLPTWVLYLQADVELLQKKEPSINISDKSNVSICQQCLFSWSTSAGIEFNAMELIASNSYRLLTVAYCFTQQ